MDDDPWLSTQELAARYKKPASTVRYWRHNGYGPKGTRIGRGVFYRLSDVTAWEKKLEAAEAAPRARV